MSKVIVVVGLTGTQGGSVANVFLKEPGWKVRGITRNPDKAQDWAAKGVEVVKADLDDKASLEAVFKGATAIFGATDFWKPFFNPANQAKLKPGQAIAQFCYDLELSQGKNIVDAAATVEGLERFVFSGLCDATKCSKGKYKWVLHFDSKAHIVDYAKEKQPKLAEKMSVVQMGTYMSNWKNGMKPAKQADGSFTLTGLGTGDTPLPQFYTQVDAGYCVRAAVQAPPGKNLLGVGSMISWKEYLKIWCDVHKVPYGGWNEISLDTYKSFMPSEDLGREFGEMLLFMSEFEYTGGDPTVILPKDMGVPIPLTTWEEYCKQEDFSSIL